MKLSKKQIEEVEELIRQAIIVERDRLATIIYMAQAVYLHDYETGEDTFDWDASVIKLAGAIRKND